MNPYKMKVSKSESEWHSAALRRFPPLFSEDLLLMTVSGIQYGLITGTKLEEEFIPGIRINEWSEYEDESGVSTSVPLERLWNFGDYAKNLVRPLLERFPVDSEAWQTLARPSTLLSMFILQEPLVLHETKLLRPAFWRRPFIKRKPFSKACDMLQSETHCRTLIKIDTGELCLAPFWAQEGDIVCQLIGCSPPIILRRHGDGKYTFVGDCYVYAKMDGEMIELLEQYGE
jgi:hypothetical protein